MVYLPTVLITILAQNISNQTTMKKLLLLAVLMNFFSLTRKTLPYLMLFLNLKTDLTENILFPSGNKPVYREAARPCNEQGTEYYKV